MDSTDWRETLKKARHEAGHTQVQAASEIGVSAATLRDWEQGGTGRPSRPNERAVQEYVDRHLGETVNWEVRDE